MRSRPPATDVRLLVRRGKTSAYGSGKTFSWAVAVSGGSGFDGQLGYGDRFDSRDSLLNRLKKTKVERCRNAET